MEFAMKGLIRYLLVSGLILGGFAAASVCRNTGRNRRLAQRKLDDALQDTFPASDPTATQDLAIPVNRQ
jgi:hypothetical protein